MKDNKQIYISKAAVTFEIVEYGLHSVYLTSVLLISKKKKKKTHQKPNPLILYLE